MEFLSKFNFVIVYQSGKKNEKANALTRKPHEVPTDNEDERQQLRMHILLLPEQIELQPIEEGEELTILERVAKSNQEDETCTEIFKYLANTSLERPNLFSKGLYMEERLLQKKNKLWVPEGTGLMWLERCIISQLCAI